MASRLACPECCARLEPGQILAAGHFPCPNCHAQLQAPFGYGQLIGLACLVFSVVTSLALGFRGFRLLYVIPTLLVLSDFLALQLLKYAVPPKKIIFAVPRVTNRQLRREIMGPTELNLRDKRR